VGAAVGGRNLKYPPIAISVASYDAKDIDYIANKSCEIINKIIDSKKVLKGKVININFPDITKEDYKGIKATVISKRDVPARPIKLESKSSNANTYKYRYNLSGEPIKDDAFTTDAEAVKDGFVSFSVLDYSLNSENFIEDITEFIDD
jgi:5'-nucleotidase